MYIIVYLLGSSSSLNRLTAVVFPYAWPRCHNQDEAAFRTISAFYRLIKRASDTQDAQVVLIDVGPNLGAINRSSLIAVDQIVLPLAPDLFSLQGLKNLGPTLRTCDDFYYKK